MCHWSRAVALPSLAAFEEAPSVFVLVLSAPLGGDQGSSRGWHVVSSSPAVVCWYLVQDDKKPEENKLLLGQWEREGLDWEGERDLEKKGGRQGTHPWMGILF